MKRIVIICLVIAAASLAAILLIDRDKDMIPERVAESMAESTESKPQTGLAPIVAAAKEEAAQRAEADQDEHAKQMGEEMAAQHTEPARSEAQAQGHQQPAPPESHQIHWGYSGEGGPANWGKLSGDYALCGSGLNQSPINLTGFVEAELPPLTFNYAGMAVEILNNGHTVQANYHPGSNLVVDGRIFHLKQFHFHAPSENLLNGKSYALEAHFVHADDDGDLAVVAVLFTEGEANRTLGLLWDQLPQAGSSEILAAQVRATDLLPEDRDYYRFNGSLTTPPCSQGVIWLVMKQTLPVSTEQVKRFSRLLGGPNNRPVQPLNARMVLQ